VSTVLTCDPANPDVETIRRAAKTLIRGGAVVIPTETQYGLSIRADRPDAPGKIDRIKRRNKTLPVALFVKDIRMAELFCEITEMAGKLAERFLPGPLTLIMPARPGQTAAAEAFASSGGFGVRISSSPVVAAVMQQVSFPITATSANLAGRKTPATVAEIRKELGDNVDLYLDGGPCRGVVPSTVVKAGADVEIVRHGVISDAEIKSVTGKGQQ
jgi:L-threonylcarbamoyladenylate synthase